MFEQPRTKPASQLLLTNACVCSVYEEEEEEDYGYPGHMRQASLELNVTEAASPRGNNGKLACIGATQCKHSVTSSRAMLHTIMIL